MEGGSRWSFLKFCSSRAIHMDRGLQVVVLTTADAYSKTAHLSGASPPPPPSLLSELSHDSTNGVIVT